MVSYWGVRIGTGGEFIEPARKGNYIAMGWNSLKDLSWMIKTNEEADSIRKKLELLYKKTYREGNKYQRGINVGQIFKFVKDIRKGDYVLVPNSATRTVLIGKVDGDYYFQKKRRDDCDYKHRRKVEWIKEVSRDVMSQSLKNSMGSLLTVFKLKYSDEEIQSLVKGIPYDIPLQKEYTSKQKEESIVGETINFRGLVYAPINEQGVVFLFSKVHKDLQIEIEEIKQGFPDAVGRVRTGKGFARRSIEFEFKSSGYDHLPQKCDILVCWEHDWQDCPQDIEVIELKSVIKGLKSQE